MARFNRSNFLNLEIVDDTQEYDLVMVNFDKFKIKRPTRFYTIVHDDIQRPDLLSYKLYGRVDWWWILAKINSIDDFWNDIQVGDVIQVPDNLDIEDFYMTIRVK